MSLSDQHEQIVDDIMTVINLGVMPFYPDFPERGCVGMTPESSIAKTIFSFSLQEDRGKRSLAADLYIYGGDDHGVIVTEVGLMKPDKWSGIIIANDELPIRVLRVTFERAVGMINMRGTKFEEDLLNALNKWLVCPDKLLAEFKAQKGIKAG